MAAHQAPLSLGFSINALLKNLAWSGSSKNTILQDHLLTFCQTTLQLLSQFCRYLKYCRRRQWHPTPALLPRKSHGRRSLEGCSPWGRWGLDMTEQLDFHFSLSCIGEGNGNPLQCSCLENPRNGGAWGLPYMGSHRVGHNWSDLAVGSIYCMLVAQLCLTLQPHGLGPARLLCPWDFPGKNTGVGCHSLLQGIFPSQGSNPGLPHCRQTLLSEPLGKPH